MTITVTADTDLTVWVGMRVCIERQMADGTTVVHYGRFESLRHSTLSPGNAGGILLEEPHGTCPGGATGFNLRYGKSTLTPAPEYTSLPGLVERPEWRDGQYRLWTIGNGLDFDALPAPRDGGPAMVVLHGWNMGTSTLARSTSSPGVTAADDGMHTLILWHGPATQPVRHSLHGRKYATRRDAERAAYNAGTTAFMVYEAEAARWGLPTTITPTTAPAANR